ncbi:AraC family transcriptional regulator [Agrobacterium vitis]|uniref:helix-turn-helix domain-containing protein n=1 Tax=Rhizobium/Agrobacterium group TaxID=227290 RepID=UPI0012E713A1|nr:MULTISPECIES: helix-turn-helix domain-containing protein [Rhizobium/Agrobacterium group]MCF1445273.1 helix-turn-helix domain-containing protein [Allorhizobium ampelinum]MVA69917.1 helix-turn-helix domain-containing protein [Agrobacterium vitis]BCH67082.1 AraC family transcriptional regulator [Agrobacterium vitis]
MAAIPTYKLYGEKTEVSGEFLLHCETLFSRSSLYRFEIDLHRHENFLQILYISEGQGDATLDGKVIAITPPAAIVVPPLFSHGFRFSRAIKGMIITVLPAALPLAVRTSLKQALPLPLHMPLEGEPCAIEIGLLMERIAEEYAGAKPGRNGLLEAYLATVVLLLARQAAPDASQDLMTLTANDRRMEKLAALIAANFRSHKTAAFYAREMGLSPTHLNRLAKAGTGATLQQLIARKQLEIAQQELIFSQTSIQAIALNHGFTDPAYFTRFFTRETGLTPRAWRLAERQKLQNLSDRAQAEISAATASE